MGVAVGGIGVLVAVAGAMAVAVADAVGDAVAMDGTGGFIPSRDVGVSDGDTGDCASCVAPGMAILEEEFEIVEMLSAVKNAQSASKTIDILTSFFKAPPSNSRIRLDR
jgi:hypothetical protein